MPQFSFLFSSTCSLLFPSLLVWTLVWGKGERKSSLLLQTVPLEKSTNAVFKNPCSLMYRFVLLSIGFNLNMVYLYLTFSPLSQSFVLHYAVGGFQEEASFKPVCIVWLSVWTCGLVSFFMCSFVPVDTKTCYWVMMARTIEQHG